MEPFSFAANLCRSFSLWTFAVVFFLPLEKRSRSLKLRGTEAILANLLLFFLLGLLPHSGLAIFFRMSASLLTVSAFFWLCAQLTPYSAIYCGVWVNLLWNLVCMGSSFLCRGFPFYPAQGLSFLLYLLVLGISGLTLARWMPDKGRYHTGPRQFTFAMALWAISLGGDLAYLAYHPLFHEMSQWLLLFLLKFYCITVLYLQHGLFQKSAIRQELALLNTLWLQQKEQYALSRENIALINRKCHDMKHQIQALQVSLSREAREKYFREVEQSIRIYDVQAKTGNEVLDTVLTEKSLLCEDKKIQANCVADGRLLAFMDPVDLYTIFGNALDNAIESVSAIEDPARRIIDLQVYGEKQMLVIQIINPVNREITFDAEDFPVTTKEDNGYHGFGLRSIGHTVKKYGGFMTVKVEDGSFYLRLLLPKQTSSLPAASP